MSMKIKLSLSVYSFEFGVVRISVYSAIHQVGLFESSNCFFPAVNNNLLSQYLGKYQVLQDGL
jgi:hypothetical protein